MAAHELSLAQAALEIREGRLSAVELARACLERVAAVEGEVQAWTFLDPQHVLAQAERADDWRRHGKPLAPLHGVPVGIKDIFDTSDMPTELVPDPCRSYAAQGCGLRRAAAVGGRGDHGQNGDDRIRLFPSRQDTQPARCRAHARRIVQRLGRGRCCRHGARV